MTLRMADYVTGLACKRLDRRRGWLQGLVPISCPRRRNFRIRCIVYRNCARQTSLVLASRKITSLVAFLQFSANNLRKNPQCCHETADTAKLCRRGAAHYPPSCTRGRLRGAAVYGAGCYQAFDAYGRMYWRCPWRPRSTHEYLTSIPSKSSSCRQCRYADAPGRSSPDDRW